MISQTQKFYTFFAGVIAAAALFIGGCDMKQKEQEIAYVDMAEVIAMSGLAVEEKNRLEEVVSALKKTSVEAEKMYKKMDEAKVKEARKSDQMVLNQLLAEARQSARLALISEVRQAVEKIRKQENIKVVLDGATVLTADQKMNITEKVAASLKGVKPFFGPLPDLKVTKPEEVKKESPTK